VNESYDTRLDEIESPWGEVHKLGCLVPEIFPTNAPKFADTFASEMKTLDECRAILAAHPNGKTGLWGRRQKWAGPKYIRNQRHHGSCNGFSTAHMLSRMRELRGEPYVCLSGADAYSQMNGNRDRGSALIDGLRIVEANGIAPEEDVPWNMIYSSQIPSSAKAKRARFKGFTTYAVDEEAELATAMVLGRLGVVAVHVTGSFYRQDGNGVNLGVNGVGNHSTGCQDIRLQDDGTLNFDQPNSWDVTWCDGGYTWLTWRGQLQTTVRNHRFWILVSSTDDQSDGSTPPPVKA
jgi:hypothetical protein